MFSRKWGRQYSTALIYAANFLLVLTLLVVRSARIAESATPFITVEFVGLLAVATGLAMVSIYLTYSRRLHRWLAALSRPVIAANVIVSLLLLAVLNALIVILQPYILPFLLWLVMSDVGIVLLAIFSGNAPEKNHDHKPDVVPQQMRRWLKNAVIVVLGILIPLLIVEIGLRVWFTYFGTEADRVSYVYSVQEIASRGRLKGYPYINFGLSPDYPSHNSLGYRGPEISRTKPDGVFRIVALGGSTTYGVSLDWREAYPAQLEQILRDEYGYNRVEVINAGVVAYASWDTLVNFEFRVLDLNPDMVIVYHAINDVIARLVDPAHYNGLNPARGIWRVDPEPLSPSVLYRFIAINMFHMPNPGWLESQLRVESDILRCAGRDDCGPLLMTPEEVLAKNPPVYFERNLRSLVSVAGVNDVSVMVSSWAYFPDSLGDDIDPFMTYPHIQQAVADHNAILRRLAEELGLPFYDLAGRIPYDPDYWLDGLHLSVSGAHEQAAEYAAFLVENNLLPESAKGN